ncbi:MAG: hypothetical protein K8R76_09695 [Candidatus Aegiribacteria sp.]|nr:hypothetical protein [Candidatus Aegiribacteria sp.]
MKNIAVRLFPLVVLFFLASVAIAGSGRYYEVTITLTDEQANAVLNSRSGEAEIEFTKEQFEIITDIVPLFDYEVITLVPEYLSRSHAVLIEIHVPDDYPGPESYIRMDPQPSP